MTTLNDHKAGFTRLQQKPVMCLSIALSRNLLDRVTEEEIYRRTDSVQYSTPGGLEVVHTAVRCSLSALPLRNAQFHLTETFVSADTNLPIWTAATIQRGLQPASLHTHTHTQTNTTA